MFLGSFDVRSAFSRVFGSEGSSASAGSNQRRDAGTSIGQTILDGRLKFHPVHGKEISLLENGTVVERSEDWFDHSVAFSHRPVEVNEVVTIEIVKVNRGFCGPLKIGFTAIDPFNFQSQSIVPLGRELQETPGTWLRGVHIRPTLEVGTTIHYMVNHDGMVFYGINGEEVGVIATGVDTSQTLWAALEAYGYVQSFKFVDKPMEFTCNHPLTSLIEHNENASTFQEHSTTTIGMATRNTGGERRNCWSNIFPCFVGRRAPVPSKNAPACSSSTALISPLTQTPEPMDSSDEKLCIICLENEKNTAFAKCGHLCMCYPCAEAFVKPGSATSNRNRGRSRNLRTLCPICRSPISSLFRIYTS